MTDELVVLLAAFTGQKQNTLRRRLKKFLTLKPKKSP